MNTPLLLLNRVSAVLQDHKILDAINLTVMQGSHLAIVGKSGSGKSALLKAIAGKQGISSGSVIYNFNQQQDQNAVEPLASRRIAFIESRHHFKNFSNTTDFYYQQRYNSAGSEDSFTVEQYLKSIETTTQDHYWTLARVITKLRLTDLYNKQLIKLSNGETKRLRIAAALIRNPALLLLDQPLTGLDVDSRAYFNVLLQEISASGVTVIMSASPIEIPDIIQQIGVLENGKLVKQLTTEEFKNQSFNYTNYLPDIDHTEVESLLKTTKDHFSFEWVINMNQVSVQYGDVTVLKDVTWQVKQGERWALLGPNGAGKSTLLSLAYGDNPQAYSNDIVLFDKKRGTGESIWDIKRRCGFVSPELFQYFPMDNNCLQVIESGFYDTLGLFRMSEPSRSALALRWMKVLNIDKYAHTLLKNIPASAQRLCLLARALVKNPVLLILDEPCQGMDDEQQQYFKHIIDLICDKSSLTLIYVTHYQHELPNAVNNVIRLEKGKIAAIETVSS